MMAFVNCSEKGLSLVVVLRLLLLNIPSCWLWWQRHIIPATWEAKAWEYKFKASLDNLWRPYLKIKNSKGDWRHSSMIEHLPNMRKAQNLIPSIAPSNNLPFLRGFGRVFLKSEILGKLAWLLGFPSLGLLCCGQMRSSSFKWTQWLIECNFLLIATQSFIPRKI